MVQMDVQFLAGVAVTVFLALLFFAVVVLWDVALALRSVGDKIDKLEDNLDDDLTEIGHSLDGMSNARGGGGTQLHLSGGTISSGPTANREAPASGARGAAQGTGDPRYRHPEHPQEPGEATAERDPPPDRARDDDRRTGQAAADSDAGEPDGDTPADAGDADTAADGTDETDVDGEDEAGDEAAATQDADEDADAGDPADRDEPEDEGRERGADANSESDDGDAWGPSDGLAERNRGRFVTAPGVTPWYVTPLDRGAIANARPDIAGELESPEAASRRERDDDPIVAGPASEDDIEPTADVEADGAGPRPNAAGGSTRQAEPSGGGDTRGPTEAATPTSPDSETVDERDAEDAAEAARDGSEATTDGDGPVFTDDRADASDVDPVDREESPDDETVLSYEERDDATGEGADDTGQGADAGEPIRAGPADGDANPELPDHGTSPDDVESIGFDDLSDLGRSDETEDDVTVEDAVDRMNDDAPALSLSSHDFDVVAESDDDGAVLLFEFDPATVELAGSTERLLRYQLRSFADDGETPEGDVAIEGQTVVVEIPDPEGNDVQRWGEAAVSIIDRTLYLSDNSG